MTFITNQRQVKLIEHYFQQPTTTQCFQKTLGNYEIKETLGTGSFSKTKLGVCKETGKRVAIKILKQTTN